MAGAAQRPRDDQPGTALSADTASLTPEEARRRLRGRNRALLLVLAGVVVLFYVLAIVRLAIR